MHRPPSDRPDPPGTTALSVFIFSLLCPLAGCSSGSDPRTTGAMGATGDAGATGGTDGSANTLDAMESSADVRPLAGFTRGTHGPLPVVPNQGGPVLDHLQLVVVTYADDPRRVPAEAFGRWVVGSDWLSTVAAEYGISRGTFLAAVERTDNAPDALTDNDVESMLVQGIRDGSIASPPGNDFSQALYMVYLPAHTTIRYPTQGGGMAQSCRDFGAYHGEVNATGLDFAYAVVPTCSYPLTDRTDLEQQEVAASHEMIEAALDPLGQSAPAWLYGRFDPTPWVSIGGELGDLCSLPSEFVRQGGHALQRVWSNAAATAGDRDPCVPAPAVPYYYTVTASDPDGQSAAAGTSVIFHLDAWSTGPVPTWNLSARPISGFTPTFSFDHSRVGNGQSATVTVGVPAGTASRSSSLIYVYSAASQTDYHITPLRVTVP